MTEEQLSIALELIAEVCTVHEVQDVLRDAKTESSKIRISGKTKNQVVLDNLREAYLLGTVSDETLHRLIREAEEHGGQHIYFYSVPLPQVEQFANFTALFSKHLPSGEATSWTQYNLNPTKLELIEIRIDDKEKGNAFWTLKFYHREIRYKFKSQDEKDGILTKTFVRESFRNVYIVRWSKLGVLEIRTPNFSAVGASRNALAAVLNKTRDLINLSGEEEFDLANARHALVADRKKNSSMYTLGSFQMVGSNGGNVTLASHTTANTIDDDPLTADVAEEFDETIDCKYCAITWRLPNEIASQDGNSEQENAEEQSAEDPKKDEFKVRPLHTVIGLLDRHHLHVGAQTSSTALDYVTDQLFKFTS